MNILGLEPAFACLQPPQPPSSLGKYAQVLRASTFARLSKSPLSMGPDLRQDPIGSPLAMAVREVLMKIQEQFSEEYRGLSDLKFDLSFMTFDDDQKRLTVVD